MAEISKIKLPSGTEYDIKDATARAAIAGGTSFLGVTTTALTDGSSTTTITIGGESVNAVNGGMVIYESKEFVYSSSDSKWHEFGDTGDLKALAYKDTASGDFTPSGTVSKPTFTGSSSTVTITATDNSSGNYQPKGTVSNPTFTGTEASISSSATYTPAGSVGLTTENKTTTVSKASSGTATYTPEGSVSAPTINVETAGSTTTIKNPTSVTVAKTVVAAAPGATAPSNSVTYYDVSGETLSLYQIGYTTGASITTENKTVKTGDAAYSASAPTFTGTGARLVTGNIAVPTSASFTGTEATIQSSATYTPAGTNSTPTFTGTKTQLSGTTTASGTVSKPTFTGTKGTVTVS